MQNVQITATNINTNNIIRIQLQGDNKTGYKAYCNKMNKWVSPLFLRDDEERKITRRLFNGTDTTLYYIDEHHKKDYTAVEDYHIAVTLN